MTEFSVRTIKCIADWSKKAIDCDGNIQCLDTCAKCFAHAFQIKNSKAYTLAYNHQNLWRKRKVYM